MGVVQELAAIGITWQFAQYVGSIEDDNRREEMRKHLRAFVDMSQVSQEIRDDMNVIVDSID